MDKGDLRSAIQACSDRGLILAAKWLSELLLSLSAPQTAIQPPSDVTAPTLPSFSIFASPSPSAMPSASGPAPSVPAPSPSQQLQPDSFSTPIVSRKCLIGDSTVRAQQQIPGSALSIPPDISAAAAMVDACASGSVSSSSPPCAFAPAAPMSTSPEQAPFPAETVAAASCGCARCELHAAQCTDREVDAVMMAKCCFDAREFQRCAELLKHCCSPVARFLRSYARFLHGEKRKEEEALETADLLQRAKVENKELRPLLTELTPLFQAHTIDAFSLYLMGLVLRELEQPEQARTALIHSVCMCPLNWAAWKTLSSLCTDRSMLVSIEEQLESIPISSACQQRNFSIMHNFFRVDVLIDLQLPEQDTALRLLDNLTSSFPNSQTVQQMKALVLYNMHEYDEAQALFEVLMSRDPYWLDGLDCYSNILYVKDMNVALSYLAHQASKIDKYRPETCCIVGNYYSLKGQHEQAILYFQRALKLNRRFLPAWTLMGHEYVELKNTAAAIEAYRFAVHINPRDYRAWYGLGQTYEILQAYNFAVFYFEKVCKLRPFDHRMWTALGDCFERLGRIPDAVQCYEKSAEQGSQPIQSFASSSSSSPSSSPSAPAAAAAPVAVQDSEGAPLLKLARLFQKSKLYDHAARNYRLLLLRRDPEAMTMFFEQLDRVGAEGGQRAAAAAASSLLSRTGISPSAASAADVVTVEALLFLAQYAMQNKQFAQTEYICTFLQDLGGAAREHANQVMAELQVQMKRSSREPPASSSFPVPVAHISQNRPLTFSSSSSSSSIAASSSSAFSTAQHPVRGSLAFPPSAAARSSIMPSPSLFPAPAASSSSSAASSSSASPS